MMNNILKYCDNIVAENAKAGDVGMENVFQRMGIIFLNVKSACPIRLQDTPLKVDFQTFLIMVPMASHLCFSKTGGENVPKTFRNRFEKTYETKPD